MLLSTFIIATLIGSGLVAGLLFIFSNCIIQSLREMPEGEGMRAMQIINRRIQNPLFFLIFFGTTLLSLAVFVLAIIQQPERFIFAVIGAACYFWGGFFITAVGNVPLNNQLDQADIHTEAGQALWTRYLRVWTRLNHLRVVLCTLAVLFLALAL